MDDRSRRSLIGELTQWPRPSASPTTLMVSGTAGLGRTTLLSRIAADLRAGGAWVDWATASELSMHRPWSVLADAVGLTLEQPPAPGTLERVLEQVEQHAADRMAVVVVDDAHVADAESLAGLGRLGAAGQDLAVRVVLSCRPDTHRERLSMLGAERWVRHVSVVPLDDAAVRRLAETRLGRPPTAAEASTLGAVGGHPLHVQRLLDALAAGRLDDATSPPMEDLVDVQLSTLAANDPAAADLVGIVAVWGAPIGADDLAALAGLPLMTTMRAITAAIDSGVVRWTERGWIEPATPTHGAAAYERLAPGLRQLLHAACLTHLRQVNAADPAATRHLAQAGAAGQSLRDVAATLHDSPGVAADVLAAALDQGGADVAAIERRPGVGAGPFRANGGRRGCRGGRPGWSGAPDRGSRRADVPAGAQLQRPLPGRRRRAARRRAGSVRAAIAGRGPPRPDPPIEPRPVRRCGGAGGGVGGRCRRHRDGCDGHAAAGHAGDRRDGRR